MSPREKNYLTLFAVVGFFILNVVAFRYYTSKKVDVLRNRLDAEQKLTVAQTFSASREQVLDQMDWLGKHEPQPAAYQDVQSTLQQLVQREAESTGLVIRPNSQKLLPTDQTAGHHYHRAKVQITVIGTEEALYRWFDKLNIPEQFRAATSIRLTPDREDDSKIECTTVIEQWFVPPPST